MKLQESKYFVEERGITYYFSTELHKLKFMKRLEENRKEVTDRLYKRYRSCLHSDYLADLYLYQTIENRGFYIKLYNGQSYKSNDEFLLYINPVDMG